MIGAEIANLSIGQNKRIDNSFDIDFATNEYKVAEYSATIDKSAIKSTPTLSQVDVANKLGISRESIIQAKAVKNNGRFKGLGF